MKNPVFSPQSAWAMIPDDLPDGAAFAMFEELTGGCDPSDLFDYDAELERLEDDPKGDPK